MASLIHPSAIIEKGAQLGANVTVGPFAIIESHAVIGDDVVVHAHAMIRNRTTIGKGTVIHPFAVIGGVTQDLKFNNEPARLEVGEYNVIREYVTMHTGTELGGMVTRVGNHGLFMIGVHVAHDCQVGNHVIMANQATLAGHVTVDDHVIIGGLSAVHQHVRIGKHAMIGGMSPVERDVIPYALIKGERASLHGLNLIGLRRRNFSRETIEALQFCYHHVFERAANVSIQEAVTALPAHYRTTPDVMDFIAFLERPDLSICQPKA